MDANSITPQDIYTKTKSCFNTPASFEGPKTYMTSDPLTATVTAHECMSPYRIIHLDEGKWPYSDFRRTLPLKARLLVERHQEVLTHEHSTADIW